MLQNNLFNSQLLVPRTLPRTDGLSLWSFPQSPLLSGLPIHLGLKRKRFSYFPLLQRHQSAHGFGFSIRHVLTKALVKQVGYRRFHLAIISFKRPKWEFFQRVPPARSDMCDSWPNNQGKKKKKKGKGGLV